MKKAKKSNKQSKKIKRQQQTNKMGGDCFWIGLANKVPPLHQFRRRPRQIIKHLQSLNCLTENIKVTSTNNTPEKCEEYMGQLKKKIKQLDWTDKSRQTFAEQIDYLKFVDARENLDKFSSSIPSIKRKSEELYKLIHELKQLIHNVSDCHGLLTESQIVSNFKWIRDFQENDDGDGTMVPFCDPWLCLICQIYRVSIDHTYNCGSAHKYKVEGAGTIQFRNKTKHLHEVSFQSNTGHFQ